MLIETVAVEANGGCRVGLCEANMWYRHPHAPEVSGEEVAQLVVGVACSSSHQ